MEDADQPRTLSTTDRSRCCRDAAEDDESTFVVDVLYGPTRVCGVVKHRVGWVKSVKDELERLRFRVNLRRVSDADTVAFAFEGRVVFACAAKSLSFGGCATRDPTADAAVRRLSDERDRAVAKLRRRRTWTAADVSETPAAEASATVSDGIGPGSERGLCRHGRDAIVGDV